MSFALTEPDAGSDAASLKTRAERDGDHYVLNGTKRFITNAPRAGALHADGAHRRAGRGGVSAFIVPADLPGIKLGKTDKKMGQRGTMTCDVILENVRVPAPTSSAACPGQGFKTAMKVLDRGRLHISARSLRQRAARARRVGALRARTQAVRQGPSASSSSSRPCWPTARPSCRPAGRWCATSRSASTASRHMRRTRDLRCASSCAKLFCTEMVGRVADRGVQVHGGAGYINDYPVERFYRDVRLLRLYEGTSQIQQLVIARELLGRD